MMRAKATFHVQNLFDFPIFLNDLLNMGNEDGKKIRKRNCDDVCIHFSGNVSLTSLMGKGVTKVKGCNGVFKKDCNMLLPLVRS
jgi:hypothetical protein